MHNNKSKIEDRFIEDNIDNDTFIKLYKTFETIYSLEYVNNEREKIFKSVKDNLNLINKDNIDAYYISTAYSYIKKWAEDSSKGNIVRIKEDGSEQIIITNLLRFAAKLYKATTVIWYELDPETDGDAGEYFAKINSGKIALTNSELIKANLMLDEYCLEDIDITFTEDEQNDDVVKAHKIKNIKELKKNSAFC